MSRWPERHLPHPGVDTISTRENGHDHHAQGRADVGKRPGKFVALLRDDLILYLSPPGAGSGGQAGGDPKPGGWNRFMIVTEALDALIGRLRGSGAEFRGDISDGGAGRAILVEDPSGNIVELFAFKKG
jgi:hypothetical protein